MAYPDFLERSLFHLEGLESLKPQGTSPVEQILLIRDATTEQLTGAPDLDDRARLIRSLLLYANDALDEAHRLVQETPGDLAAYLHGIIHRREEDFENARYWFRRAGELPFFPSLQGRAAGLSDDMAKQLNWDPYLFTTLCERSKYGARTPVKTLAALQRAEFDTLLDYIYRAG
ncbi:MAG TPA: hypothetical protein VF585_03880 [Chthoniobacterales bacterium]|jgi:hypothetical protein